MKNKRKQKIIKNIEGDLKKGEDHHEEEEEEEEEEGRKEDENTMNMELAADQHAMATELAKNDELDRLYFDKFPPGYRFCPTPEELIIHYLRNKVLNLPLPLNRIRDVNLYHFHPQQLSNTYKMHRENNLYFFTLRTRKYPNGSRPDRAAGNGYWKATGKDKKIMSQGSVVGWQKSLVYYEGLAKNHSGKKTNWIMHEYVMAPPKDRIDQGNAAAAAGASSSHASGTHGNSSTRPPNNNKLGDWVLCTIHCKPRKKDEGKQDATEEEPNGPLLEEGIADQSESRDDDHEEDRVLNPDPVQYWRSRNMANAPVMISRQVSNSTIVREGHEGFHPNMENYDHIPIHEQVLGPIPVMWDSSCPSRSTMMNGPAVMISNQQFPNPSTLAQGHEGVRNMANYRINSVRGHECGFGINMENAPISSNQLEVLDSSCTHDHHLVLQGQGLAMNMDQNNIILPPLIDYYEQDSSNWMMIPATSDDQPYLMNYDHSSTRHLPPPPPPAAAANQAPDPPFIYNYYNNDHHSSSQLDFRADHQYNNFGVGEAASSSLEYYCEDVLSNPCNEYLEIANFPPAPSDDTYTEISPHPRIESELLDFSGEEFSGSVTRIS